jgi:hypothetical protein
MWKTHQLAEAEELGLEAVVTEVVRCLVGGLSEREYGCRRRHRGHHPLLPHHCTI